PPNIGLHFQWNTFGMKEIEWPAPVLVATLNYGFDGVIEAAVRFDSCVPHIVESAQNVIVPKCREREAEPMLVDDFTRSKPPAHVPLKQIVFGPLAGFGDSR